MSRIALWAAFFVSVTGTAALGQKCSLPNANDATCFTLDWVNALAVMEQSLQTKPIDPDSSGWLTNTFYKLKSVQAASAKAKLLVKPYLHSRDTAVAGATKYVLVALNVVASKSVLMQNDLRKVANGKSSPVEMAETSAAYGVWGDQLPQLFIAATGMVADASILIERGAAHVTKRRMSVANRDSILEAIKKSFSPDSSGTYDAYGAAAYALQVSLSDEGWTYLPK